MLHFYKSLPSDGCQQCPLLPFFPTGDCLTTNSLLQITHSTPLTELNVQDKVIL
jgi:hypothetical protein